MQRRKLVVTTIGTLMAALAAAGCVSEGKVLQVTPPSSAPAARKIERVLVWLPPQEGLAGAELGKAFVSAFAPYSVPVQVRRASSLELNRSEDQAPIMAEMKATHRLEVEIASYRGQAGSTPGVLTLAVAVYEGASRRPVMTMLYRPPGLRDTSVADAVVRQLRERGYL